MFPAIALELHSPAQGPHVGLHLSRALVALVGSLGEGFPDDPLELGQRAVLGAHQRLWVAVQDGIDHAAVRRGSKGRPARRHLVEDDAEGEEVAAFVEGPPQRLLRRHVSGGAHHPAGSR